MSTVSDLTSILDRQHRSAFNAQIVLDAVAAKGCDCVPYETVFNYKDWRRLGYQVQRGQKKICRVLTYYKDEDTGKTRPAWAALFCYCQVKPIEGGKSEL